MWIDKVSIMYFNEWCKQQIVLIEKAEWNQILSLSRGQKGINEKLLEGLDGSKLKFLLELTEELYFSDTYSAENLPEEQQEQAILEGVHQFTLDSKHEVKTAKQILDLDSDSIHNFVEYSQKLVMMELEERVEELVKEATEAGKESILSQTLGSYIFLCFLEVAEINFFNWLCTIENLSKEQQEQTMLKALKQPIPSIVKRRGVNKTDRRKHELFQQIQPFLKASSQHAKNTRRSRNQDAQPLGQVLEEIFDRHDEKYDNSNH